MFTTRYANELPNTYTQVNPTPLNNSQWVCWNSKLAEEMQIPISPDDDILKVFSGQSLFQGHNPIAQKYAGHQFGGWNPELGDGRGLLLGEWQDNQSESWEMHLKGAGRTPYSRFGDGRAVLRSSIREFLGGEALHSLGVASTRALGIVGSDEQVVRESLETGAMIMRIAKTHIRFGHFEWFAFSNQPEQLSRLVNYTVKHHFPKAINSGGPAEHFFDLVVEKTAKMIAGWMAYGFCHGVMNTDNMSILGDTFDFGPYAFLDQTNLEAVFNHTDEGGRYAFNKQPDVGLWNLQRLAQALSKMIDSEALTNSLQSYSSHYYKAYYQIMNGRLGGTETSQIDAVLINEWVELLAAEEKDFHCFFRELSNKPLDEWMNLKDEFIDSNRYKAWCEKTIQQTNSDDSARQDQMQNLNPITIARTHHLQSVIDSAEAGDFKPTESLLLALQSPFTETKQWAQWHQPPAGDGNHVELSCSS